MAEGTSEPALADVGRPFDDQILRLFDPATGDQRLEQRAIETAGGATIDVLDRRLMAQPGIAQPGSQPSLVAFSGFAVEQEAQPFGMRQPALVGFASSSVKARAMPGEAELVKLV